MKIFKKTKKTKVKRAGLLFVCAAVAAVTAFTAFVSACGVDGTVYTIPESQLPIEELHALKQYSYDDLSDVQTTVRSDVMNVTKRNLPRPQTELLSDKFSLVYDAAANQVKPVYGELKGDASIDFVRYPYPGGAGGGDGSAAQFAASYAAQANDMNVSAADYVFYYKYMLMSQGQHLAIEAKQRSADGTLTQEWLKKHPAADLQYGEVKGTDNAVEKEITLDPLYRSYHASGLYLPAGEAVTVKVEGLKQGEKISVLLGEQNTLGWRGSVNDADYKAIGNGSATSLYSVDAFFTKADVLTANGRFFNYTYSNDSGARLHPFVHNQYVRQNNLAPWLHGEFVFTENKTYTIGSAFGGFIHISMGNCYSKVKTTITGAVETPHYILGVTTPQYFDEYLRDAPGVIAVLDTENGQLISPTGVMGTTSYMRKVKTDEIDKLAMLWHSFLSVNESFTGGPYNRFNKLMFDQHVPAGAAVALGNYTFAHPTGWFNSAMDYRGLLRGGTWGILHEVGHSHGSSYGTEWGFRGGQEGEVRNNALILLSYITLCDVGTTIRNGGGAEHGEYANPYRTLTETLGNKGKFADFNNLGYFQALGMYANIMHSFGAEKFYELLYTYKSRSSYVEEGTSGNNRSDFAYRCSLVYGMNFLKYFNEFYSANITDGMFTSDQLAEMNALPNYEPVSCYYAGGIDGVKTAGDYIVAFGDDITFDLMKNTISSLDTEEGKGFEVISVNKPEHGKIREIGDGKWAYSFDKKYTGVFDTFTFDVRLSDGIIHTLSITLRISYNGARVSAYKNLEGRKWEDIVAEVDGKEPDEVISVATAGVPSYASEAGTYEARTAEFYWQAPESGEISISAVCDDWIKGYFGESFDTLEEVLQITGRKTGYADYKITRTVEAGKYYAVKILNVNTGGSGAAYMAIKYTSGEGGFAVFDLNNVYYPDYPLGTEAETYIYEPQYLVSKKNNIKLSVTGTDKSEWTVIKAPENVLGGRYYEQQLVDPDTGEPLEGEDGIIRIDKWTYLIDGQDGTNMHTTYGGNVKKITADNPHEFIVDMSKIQTINYFSVATRNNVNSYITDCEVQISDTPDGGWKTIATADRNSYSGTKITMKFPEVSGRYLRLIVKGTTGGNFSVLAELDAGIQSSTQQVIPPTSKKFFATTGWENSTYNDEEPNGYLIANAKNEKVVIKFRGESIALYAATGEDYGSVAIYVDGRKITEADLNSATAEARKLIFNKENLEDKEHTVEIITTSAGKVMLNVTGIPYTAELINAANIYKENALTIALVIFVLLFAAITAFVVCLVVIPSFRGKVFGNRFIAKLDNREKKPKAEKKKRAPEAKTEDKTPAKKAEKPEKAKAEKSKTEKPAKPATDKKTKK